MDVKDIKKVLEAVAASEVSEFVLETGDYKLTVKREQQVVASPATAVIAPQPESAPAVVEAMSDTNSAAPATPPSDTASNAHEVTAPIVGTFYAAPSPDAGPFVSVGDRVEKGAVLCIIEAMKLMNEIEADMAGTIRQVLVNNEDPVEYGQVLFHIEPA